MISVITVLCFFLLLAVLYFIGVVGTLRTDLDRLTAAVERLGAKQKPFTASDNADFLAQADWEKATTVLGGPGAPCHASPDFDSLRKVTP